MSWQCEPFRDHYRAAIGSVKSSYSYVSYLNLVDELLAGLDEHLRSTGPDTVMRLLQSQPDQRFTVSRSRSNCMSALRAYTGFLDRLAPSPIEPMALPPVDRGTGSRLSDEVGDLLREAKRVAARYYQLTGKPLGVTGEVAELEAVEKLGLTLVAARSPGFDAWRGSEWRVQIKGRAVAATDRYRGRCPSIIGKGFDSVVLVLLDRATYQAIEIWEAPRDRILARIAAPGGRARTERRSLAISQFKSVADRVWPARQGA